MNRKLKPAELADPEFMQAYVESCHDSFAQILAENKALKEARNCTLREVRNKMTLDGHLNAALDSVLMSNSPDGIFCTLGELADKAIELTAQRQPWPDVRHSEQDWWYKELLAIYTASKDTELTLDMKRAVNIAMRVAEGKVYDDALGWDFQNVHLQQRHKMGEWFEARDVEDLHAFYMYRLPAIRDAAHAHGYAIGVHGSCKRDLDLIAMQWREDASEKNVLARALANAACGIYRDVGTDYTWEQKPAGRVATSIPICWTVHSEVFKDMIGAGHIDLSLIDSK